MLKPSLATLFSVFSACAVASQTLPNLKLDSKITLSGLSSGAYMAGQYHLAYAEQVTGVAMLAGGPVYCAQNSLGIALEHCLNKASSAPDITVINTYIQKQRELGALAAESALEDDKVWIFHGSNDQTVSPHLSNILQKQYLQWLPKENIRLVTNLAVAHTFPTDNAALGECNVSAPPFLANCRYDAAGELLQFILGDIQPRTDKAQGQLLAINQHQLSSAAAHSLAEQGYVYVPASCASGTECKLHVSLHGCKQNADAIGATYATSTGLNNYADNNKLVILYPQTRASNINPFNPNACWDWWGYSGADYATRTGVQIQAIAQLVKALQTGQVQH